MNVAVSSLVVEVTELLRRPGTRKEFSSSASLDNLGLSTSNVPAGKRVNVALTLEAQGGDTITATGTVSASWMGTCRRCLGEVRGTIEQHVQEVFERSPTEGETYPLVDEYVDLVPPVRDAVLLALPFAPLCGAACRGPAPGDHPVMVGSEARPSGHDTRWDVLNELKFDA